MAGVLPPAEPYGTCVSEKGEKCGSQWEVSFFNFDIWDIPSVASLYLLDSFESPLESHQCLILI